MGELRHHPMDPMDNGLRYLRRYLAPDFKVSHAVMDADSLPF